MFEVPIIVPVTNPLELSPDEFLKVYDNTVKYVTKSKLTKAQYIEFCRRILYYGMHRKAPINVYFNEGIFDMARNYNGPEFVECNLGKDDEKALEKFIQQYSGNVGQLLTDIGSEDYTIKVGFYVDHSAYACFLSPGKDNRQNRNKLISSWSDDPLEVIFMCWFKHKVVFGGDEWTSDKTGSKWG